MKAVRLVEDGGQLVFDEVPKPAIARDELLVAAERSDPGSRRQVSVNPVFRPQALFSCRGLRWGR